MLPEQSTLDSLSLHEAILRYLKKKVLDILRWGKDADKVVVDIYVILHLLRVT
jgi:hypothetical protein